MNYEINDVEKAKVGNKTAFENLYSAVYREYIEICTNLHFTQ